MSATDDAPSRPHPQPSRTPWVVVGIAVVAAMLHLLPTIVAWSATPDGWRFTGITTSSVDFMQYRVWWRQTQTDGPLIENLFTSEPNRPHMVLLFAYSVGALAQLTSLAPEFVFALAGSAFAFVFTLLLYWVVRAFVADRHQAAWIFGAILVSGGMGAHLKLLAHVEAIQALPILQTFIYEPLAEYPVFEDYRGHYVFTTWFDTHFLLLWLLATACMLALLRALERMTTARLVAVALIYGFTTLVHLYEGVTLLAITALVMAFSLVKRVAVRPAALTAVVSSVAVLVALALHGVLLSRSGLPAPTWRATMILPSILFLAYPLAWILSVRGIPAAWRHATVPDLVLLGWAGGCTMMTLSGPFYPYPDRGTLTLQIPITILAGLTYFSLSRRVTRPALVIAALLLLATPLWSLARIVERTGESPTARPSVYVGPAHEEILQVLGREGRRDDVLLSDQASMLWLAPGFVGRHYASHFFLTPEYDRKATEVASFFDSSSEVRSLFLQRHGITLVFDANPEADASQEASGLQLLRRSEAGALYRVVRR